MAFSEDLVVRAEEICDAICKLDDNNVLWPRCYIYTAFKTCQHYISAFVAGFLVQGVIPHSMIAVLLVPFIKDKTSQISSKDNYRPNALASIMSNILKRFLLDRLELYILTNGNQFGFKRKHGTHMCSYAFKEIVSKYLSLNSTKFVCFLNASKVFDKVNHAEQFHKLSLRDVPH